MNIKINLLKIFTLNLIFIVSSINLFPVVLRFTDEDRINFTPEWDGERFIDGRPKVPDDILDRMEKVSIEEAWSVLRNNDYKYQFERGWEQLHPEQTLTGRAFTAMYMPKRDVLHKLVDEKGEKEGRVGSQVSWPIDMLKKNDIYVADVYGRTEGGPIIGGNLATAIYNKTGKGVVFDGEARDLEQIKEIDGFNAFVRNWHPSYYWASTLVGINTPIRIGNVTVMPGDVVLAKREGIIFIPPHLAEKVVKTAEIVRLRDMFGFQRMKEGIYTSGQIDGRWSEEIEKDFSTWLEDHMDELPVPKEQIQEILKERTW